MLGVEYAVIMGAEVFLGLPHAAASEHWAL